jgi:acetylserotonin N-methyltransferase
MVCILKMLKLLEPKPVMAQRRLRNPRRPWSPGDDRPIWDAWFSCYWYPAIMAADHVGIFQILSKKGLSEKKIAENLNLGPRSAQALLGVLHALGFLARRLELFVLTRPARDFLLPDSPTYWGGMFIARRNDTIYQDILRAIEGERTRLNTSEDGHPDPQFTDWKRGSTDPDRARKFTAAMHSHSMAAAWAAARKGDWTGIDAVLDIAGGSGCFMTELVKVKKSIHGTVLELPEALPVVNEYIQKSGHPDRVTATGGDMFHDEWPSQSASGRFHNAVFFSNVFHDWSETQCRELARKAFDFLPIGGRIYLHEVITPFKIIPPPRPSWNYNELLAATTFSLVMLIRTEGKQFHLRELRKILGDAGFTGIKAAPTWGYYSLIQAQKA